MFGWGDFWDKSSSWFLEILKMPSFYQGNFKIFKNALGEFMPNLPPKHVISSNKFIYFTVSLTSSSRIEKITTGLRFK